MAQTLDPLISLAFSLRASAGVYALLLGSGISRSAGIPTGWELVLDLIKRVAAAQSESPNDRPEIWYADKYGKEAGYSELLDTLCHTRIERQQLLKGYFEPNEEERGQGVKLPTAAHHAIAELMVAGLIKVVITTNFDRLLEQALEQRGIIPVVIGSADQATGMIPLTHQKHCIIKVHGDYLDTRILNTEEELSSYQSDISGLVDRVFEEFGLIVCGWSATWDVALRASIDRGTSRRYSCYWATTGELSEEAKSVVAHRRAEIINIESADTFFSSLLDRVRGLEEFDRPHPLSVQAAVGATKRYLVDASQRIRLHDLYRDAISDAKTIWKKPAFAGQETPEPSPDTVAKRVKAFDASAATVIALNATIGRWSRGDEDDLLVEAIGEIGREPIFIGVRHQYQDWNYLQPYPATRMLYAAGMASLVAKRPALFSRLMTVRTPTVTEKNELSVSRLVAPLRVRRENLWGLFDNQRRHVPMNDWLHDSLRDTFLTFVPSDGDYDLLFDTFEFYLAVAYAASTTSVTGWVPLGSWAAHRHASFSTIISGLNGDDVRFGGKEFAGSCPVFSRNGKDFSENVKAVEVFRSQVSFY